MKNKKVYCINCNYYCAGCCSYGSDMEYSYIFNCKVPNSYNSCQENKNGKCKYYKRKWWKFWRSK